MLRMVRRYVPSTADYHGDKVFIRKDGMRLATPVFAVLLGTAGNAASTGSRSPCSASSSTSSSST